MRLRTVTVMTETHDKRTETRACDLISRQAAIDAYITNCPYFSGKNTIDRSVYGTHIGACSLEYHYEKICPSPKCLCAEGLGLKDERLAPGTVERRRA